jgi:antitoxin MazE
MKTTVQRWGNSLALRIPKTFAEEISVREGDEVEMNIAKGRLVVAPRPPRDYHLADLVAGIRPGNLHKEIITGKPQGKEVW